LIISPSSSIYVIKLSLPRFTIDRITLELIILQQDGSLLLQRERCRNDIANILVCLTSTAQIIRQHTVQLHFVFKRPPHHWLLMRFKANQCSSRQPSWNLQPLSYLDVPLGS
jgi:hypothetical protein